MGLICGMEEVYQQMERYIGKPKGRSKEFFGFKLHGTSGDPVETAAAGVDMD